MSDYGHPLRFGTFLTPSASDPDGVVALARLTEAAGLDLATFQDHPYQPAFLDTWTLLSWVAAQTRTLRVSANVLNLPLRAPAVVARAAASLDLLSGGRFELGLGAGGFPDAVAAMGGPRRSPGEAVDALSEAIDIIRAIWDTSARGGVRVRGEHYEVSGAKRGPEPAHDIGIWLGAYKPRMLRLTGRRADGWLPSLMYLPREDLGPANDVIDAAAVAAGRDPRAIRRLLNIGPEDATVDALAPLALEHGFSTFILASDDPEAIERFGREVAPALRDAVAAARDTAGDRSGSLPAALAATAVRPGDPEYRNVRSTYVHTGSPAVVLRPGDAAQVADALAYARQQDGAPIAVRSGGHGVSGRATNDGGIVIDLGRLDAVEVLDPATGLVRVGPGARWGDVARVLSPRGLAISSGDFGDVGVGGLATAGGVGFLGRGHGLTIDRILAADVLLADGRLVRADADSDPDLFWALRGAGGSFGVVTSFVFAAAPVGDVVHSRMVFTEADAGVVERWAAAVEAAPRELTSFLTLTGRGVAHLQTVFAGDDPGAATAALTPLLDIGGQLVDQRAELLPYHAVIPTHGARHRGGPEPALRSAFVDHVTPEVAGALELLLRTGTGPFVQIRAVGGAINDVDPAATAWAHRHQNFLLTVVGPTLAALNRRWDVELAPLTDGMYSSFNSDPRPERLAEAFPGATLERLRELKAVYDPDDVFDGNLPIAGARAAAAALAADA